MYLILWYLWMWSFLSLFFLEPPYPSEKMKHLCEMSESSLEEGVALFKGLSDKANTALLYTNKGRLMRLLAQVHTQNTLLQDSPQFTEIERKYYKQVQLLPSAFFFKIMLINLKGTIQCSVCSRLLSLYKKVLPLIFVNLRYFLHIAWWMINYFIFYLCRRYVDIYIIVLKIYMKY